MNFVAIPFGLAGLGEVWFIAAETGLVPNVVGEALLALAALVWLVVLAACLRYVRFERGAFQADLLDPVAGPFASPVVIVPLLLAVLDIAPHAPVAGGPGRRAYRLDALAGAWFTGQWIYSGLELDRQPGCRSGSAANACEHAQHARKLRERTLGELHD